MAALLANRLRVLGLTVSAPAATATDTTAAPLGRPAAAAASLRAGGSASLINNGDARSAAELAARTRVFVVLWSAQSIAALASLDGASHCDEGLLEARVALALKAHRGARYEVIPVLVGAPTRWSRFWRP